MKILSLVSVPLRGYGFEIIHIAITNIGNKTQFPSPCGDMVLK